MGAKHVYRNTLVHRRRLTRLAPFAKGLARFGFFFLIGAYILRLWRYATPYETVLMFGLAGLMGAIAFVLGIMALVRIWFRGFDGLSEALSSFFYSAICLTPIIGSAIFSVLTPMQNDVATLSSRPPVFMPFAQMEQERASPYLGAPLGQPQVVSDLFPLQTAQPRQRVESAVRNLAASYRWRLVDVQGGSGNAPLKLQYVVETLFMRYQDDVVIELRPASGAAIEVHMRSASRLGLSDMGANEARIRGFLSDLATRLSVTTTSQGL